MNESKKPWESRKPLPSKTDEQKDIAAKRLDDVERRVSLIEKELGLERH